MKSILKKITGILFALTYIVLFRRTAYVEYHSSTVNVVLSVVWLLLLLLIAFSSAESNCFLKGAGLYIIIATAVALLLHVFKMELSYALLCIMFIPMTLYAPLSPLTELIPYLDGILYVILIPAALFVLLLAAHGVGKKWKRSKSI